MSLKNQQKQEIRCLNIYKCLDTKRDGKEKKITIPQFSEIFENMLGNLLRETGATKIERCPPSKANCIIRVYSARHEYSFEVCNLYGADCYTKIHGEWETSDGVDNYPITYHNKYKIRIIRSGECRYCYSDYVDYYVKIT